MADRPRAARVFLGAPGRRARRRPSPLRARRGARSGRGRPGSAGPARGTRGAGRAAGGRCAARRRAPSAARRSAPEPCERAPGRGSRARGTASRARTRRRGRHRLRGAPWRQRARAQSPPPALVVQGEGFGATCRRNLNRVSSDGRRHQEQARIMLRPIGSGLPLGFFAFAIGMLLLGCSAIGWIPVAEQKDVGMLLIVSSFRSSCSRPSSPSSPATRSARRRSACSRPPGSRSAGSTRLAAGLDERHRRDLPVRLRDRGRSCSR